jgi:predicted Zn-dependent peptidase
VIGGELERIVGAEIAAEELHRAQENVKGRLVLALESTTARMDRLGSSVLAQMPIISVDDLIARVDAVTAADCSALARELFDPTKLCAAGIGPDEDLFTQALTPLSGDLVGLTS